MRRRSIVFAAPALLMLMLAALACNCGSLTRLTQIRATFQAADATVESVEGEYGPTIRAQLTSLGPTIAAASTMLIEQATQRGPELNATLTAAVATVDALLNSEGRATFDAQMTNLAATSEAAFGDSGVIEITPPPGSDNSGELPAATPPGGENPAMPLVEWLDFGESRTVEYSDTNMEHSWLFEGNAGQNVTVVVESSDAQPTVSIISPAGDVIDEQNITEESTVTVTATLTEGGGIFTARVTLSAPGQYTITLR